MAISKKLEIIYHNGQPDGIRSIRRHLSTMTTYVIPRPLLSEAKKLTGINRPGIYYLISETDDNKIAQIYVGQTRNGVSRLDDHNRSKDFWNKAIMFLADNKTFSLDMISGLEAFAIDKAIEAKRYKVENTVNPKYEIDEYDLPLIEEVYEEIKFIMATQGYKMEKSYMWLYRTSGSAKQAIVLYEYQPTRKAEHAEAFLKGFSGWLHADGYQGYHKLPGNIRVVGCWAHARRKFDEALGTLPQEKRKDSPAAMGECYCSQLFKLEQALAELTPEERYEKRLEQEKPVLDALLSWANEMQTKTAPKSALGKAIHYLQEQWPYLTRYLEDGRLELSNNRAERSIKPFVMGRKNWLFANTPGGAQASSVIYSLIETAKENGLDPYQYLLWILRNAPVLSQADAAWA